MNVVFVEPAFPSSQRHFVRAPAEVGATVIGERPEEWLDHELRGHLQHYHQIGSVTDVGALQGVVEWIQGKVWVDRLEATVEGHHPTGRAGPRGLHHPRHLGPYRVAVPGQAVMKAALRDAGVPTAVSVAADHPDQCAPSLLRWATR